MAKKSAAKGKSRELDVDLTKLLWFGVVLIIVSIALGIIFPAIPKWICTVLYLMAILAFIIYMWQNRYEKRTGKTDKDSEFRGNRLK